MLRTRLALLATVALAGCLSRLPQRPPELAQPAFDPAMFFAGRTQGEGTLDLRIGTDRSLTVESTGHAVADSSFQLDQTIRFADGTTETRTWVLQRTDATHYHATLSDAKGPVRAEVRGNLLHLRYLLRHPAVYMEQWLYLQPDGQTVRNLAQVTVLGIPWARLSETIRKAERK